MSLGLHGAECGRPTLRHEAPDSVSAHMRRVLAYSLASARTRIGARCRRGHYRTLPATECGAHTSTYFETCYIFLDEGSVLNNGNASTACSRWQVCFPTGFAKAVEFYARSRLGATLKLAVMRIDCQTFLKMSSSSFTLILNCSTLKAHP